MLKRLPFKLIKSTDYTIKRYGTAGVVTKGKYIRPTPTEIVIKAVVTPRVKSDITNLLPEALRKRKMIRILTNSELREQRKGAAYEADELTYDGEEYRVFKLGNWLNVNGFTAREAFAVQIDSKELTLLE